MKEKCPCEHFPNCDCELVWKMVYEADLRQGLLPDGTPALWPEFPLLKPAYIQ